VPNSLSPVEGSRTISATGCFWRKAAGHGHVAPGGRTDMSRQRAEVAFWPL